MRLYVESDENVGGAMDITLGCFTASVPVIYHFDFSFVKTGWTGAIDFYIQLNEIAFMVPFVFQNMPMK